MAPTLYLGVRLPVTDLVYGDPARPERVTRHVAGPLYTPEDHALLAALKAYEDDQCPGCSQPIVEAWHAELEGWYEADAYVCHACTAAKGHEVAYTHLRNTRPHSKGPLPPFSFEDTTTEPTPPPSSS